MEKKPGTVSDSAGQSGTGRVLSRTPSQKILNVLHFIFGFLGWSVRWTAAVIFFVGVMVLVAWYVFNQAALGGNYVTVPDVTGLPVTSAANVLADVGLELGAQTRAKNDSVPAYHVIVQRPRAGDVVRAGRKINLTVSEGEQVLQAPGFLGKSLNDARSEIESTRFMMGSVARVPDSRPADTILAQDPPPLTLIGPGSEIHFLVSGGPVTEVVRMPALVGKNLDEAQLALANLNVTIVPVNVDRVGVDYDVVLAQNPEPGTTLTEGQEVSFEVRLSASSYLPNARRQVSGQYTVPDYGRLIALRVEMADEDGSPKLYYPGPGDYENGRQKLLPPGTLIKFKDIKYTSELTIRFYVDGVLQTTYYYQGDVTQPLITTNTAAPPALEPDNNLVHMEELEPNEPADASTPRNPFSRSTRTP